MSVSIIHKYQCDYCGLISVEQTQGRLIPYSQLLTCDAPAGWTWINDQLACPLHQVQVEYIGPRKQE